MKKAWGLFVAAVCVLAVLAACTGGGGSSPGAVVQRFFSLSNRGQSEEALKLVMPENEGLIASSMMWDAVTAMVGVKFIGTVIEGAEISGEQATVHYRLRYNPSMYDSAGEVDLVKTDGEWKIWEVR